MVELPRWAEEMRRVYRSGTVSQFVIHGAVSDLVQRRRSDGRSEFVSLDAFLQDVMLGPFDLGIRYDRGQGIQVWKGRQLWQQFVQSFDDWNKTDYAKTPRSVPRTPSQAMDVLDRCLDWAAQRTEIVEGKLVLKPLRVALLIDHAHFLAPRGESVQVSGYFGETVVHFLGWSSDRYILDSGSLVVLVTENVNDLNQTVVNNPHTRRLEVPLPEAEELEDYTRALMAEDAEVGAAVKLDPAVVGRRTVGLSRVNLRNALRLAARNGEVIDGDYLSKMRRVLIEKECQGLLDFIESPYTLDAVAGHDEVVTWLRDDAQLLREGKTRSIPMGYLMCGRIGTGKTFITTCWAGEVGIPCVVLKNFRDKWQGSTEGNLEKIFTILKALGQVIVFVDEADQATGRRDSGATDSGLSGRVYAMLAKEMSDTRNRGRIVWVFATSRPDLVEVDLKRPGRLDVHIPLFPPHTADERRALFKAMARKLGVSARDLPDVPAEMGDIGGNEMEAMLVRASRRYDLQGDKKRKSLKTLLSEVMAEYRPMAFNAKLEYMDLVAVKECTDLRFLPERYRALPGDELERRIAILAPLV